MGTRLQELKKRLQGKKQESNNKNLAVFNLCAVMEVCGGYDQLLNLPMPALKGIIEYLEFQKAEQEKLDKKMRQKGKR